MEFPFLKMHGAGNDFVVVDHRRAFLDAPLAPLVRRLCDRRRGVGADGVLLLEADPELDFAMRYFNADGSDAEYCGNGARCLAALALDLGLGAGGEVRFRTAAGPQAARASAEGRVEVRFGRVRAPERRDGIEAAGRRFEGWWVKPGVPHIVIEVPDVRAVPLAEWGAALRSARAFGPEGTNVDFLEPLGKGRVAMRTFERGVEGETLACGSGAIACGLSRSALGVPGPVEVSTEGGDVLRVRWMAVERDFEVWLEGPVATVFRGFWPVASGVTAGR